MLRLLLKHTVDGGSGDRVGLRQLSEAAVELAITDYGGTIDLQRRSAHGTSFEAGAAHAGAHPLDDQVAFELGDCSYDHDGGAAQRSASVDLLAEAQELDVEPVQLVEHFEEVPGGPGDAIAGPDDSFPRLWILATVGFALAAQKAIGISARIAYGCPAPITFVAVGVTFK